MKRAGALILGLTLLAIPAAGNAEGLRLAQLPTADPAQPTETAPGGVAEDFEGNELGSAWNIINPDPDSYIVENGALTLIAKAVGGLTSAEVPNIFQLKQKPPEGDWVATIVFRSELQTGADQFEFGLYDAPDNIIVARFWADANPYSADHGLNVGVTKRSVSNVSAFQAKVSSEPRLEASSETGQPVTLKLIKSGRSYRAAANLAGELDEAGQPKWYETGTVASLRPPTAFAVNASQWEETPGESLFMIESLKIDATGH